MLPLLLSAGGRARLPYPPRPAVSLPASLILVPAPIPCPIVRTPSTTTTATVITSGVAAVDVAVTPAASNATIIPKAAVPVVLRPPVAIAGAFVA